MAGVGGAQVAGGLETAPPRAAIPTARRVAAPVRPGWLVAAGALWAVVTVELVRVWLPSVLHLASPPPPARSPLALSLVALASLLVPIGAIPAVRRIPPSHVWTVGLVGLVACRVALQLTSTGGAWQLGLAAGGVTLAVLALIGLAAGSPSGHLARVGVLAGLGLGATMHAALGTLDLTWRSGALPDAAAVGLAGAALLAGLRVRAVPLWWPTIAPEDGQPAAVWTRGPAWPWLVVGPAVLLVGTLVAVPSRMELAAGVGPRGAAAALAVATGGAAAAAGLARRVGAPWAGSLGAVGALLAAVVTLPTSGWVAVAGQLGLLVSLGAVVGALGAIPGDSGPRRRAVAATVGVLGFWALLVAYFASYEVRSPVPNRVWLLAGAAAVAVLGGAAAAVGRQIRPARVPTARPLARLALATAALVVVAATLVPAPATPATAVPGEQVRIATYNVGSGFGTTGRFDPDGLAAVLAAQEVDVVVLNEVDRGWLLEGGHDLLRLLADRLELPHATFAPAADVVWGNAVLSRHPIADVRTERLPRGDDPMSRSWVSVTVDLGPDRRLAVLGTQLSSATPPAVRAAQARALAGEASRLRGRDLPVVLLGDLGAEVDAPELEPLAFLPDATPGAAATVPADAPTTRPDQIRASDDLTATDVAVPDTAAARHRPLVVTLSVPSR